MNAQRLDRLAKCDLVAVNLEAALGDAIGDIARRNRAVKLARIARLTDRHERFAGELFANGFGFLFELKVVSFEVNALGFKFLAVFLGRTQCLVLRQQEVACVPVFHGDDVAHLSEAADALQEDDLHGSDLSFVTVWFDWNRESEGQPAAAAGAKSYRPNQREQAAARPRY